MKRETAVVCRSWLDAILELPESEQGVAALAIFEYAIYGETSRATGIAKAILTMAKPLIDNNNKRYENGCKGGEYGVLGGRPKKPLKNPKETPNITPKKPQRNPKETPVLSPPTPPSIYVNDNDISSLSLSLSPYGEKEEIKGGVTATERDRFFEIFYFRNSKQPVIEVERFINHYEASGWCRAGSNRPVRNRYALAKSWKFEDSTPRYDSTTISILKKIEPACIEMGDSKLSKSLNTYLHRIEIQSDGLMRFLLGSRETMDIIESKQEIIYKHLQRYWGYSVKK